MSQPALALLRTQDPSCCIDVFAAAWVAPVYRRMREVRQVVENPFAHGDLALNKRRRVGHELKKADYDRVIVLPNTLKSGLVPWFAGIPQRTGYLGEQRFGLLNDLRRFDPRITPRLVDRYAALAAARAGMPLAPTPNPRLIADPQNRSRVLERLNLAGCQALAALCPGAEYGPAKRWPAAHYSALASRLIADGYTVCIIGSSKDAAIGEEITALAPGVHNLCGKTTLEESVDLLSAMALTVTNDSGLMHVAAALDIPVIAVFGSSSPSYTPPLSTKAHIVRLELECSPCLQRECPLGHLRCLKELLPEQVYGIVHTNIVSPKSLP